MIPSDTSSRFRVTRRRALTGMGAALTPFALAGAMPSALAAQDSTPGATPKVLEPRVEACRTALQDTPGYVGG